MNVLQHKIYTIIKITSEFKNVSVMVGVVDGLALDGKQTWTSVAISAASIGGFDWQRSSKHKKLKPCLVASDDIQPGNGKGLFWFRCFVNLSLTYLRHLPTYSQPRIHTGPSTHPVNSVKTLKEIQRPTSTKEKSHTSLILSRSSTGLPKDGALILLSNPL